MVYDKIQIISRPTDNGKTTEVRNNVIKFCEDVDIPYRHGGDENPAFPIGTEGVLVVAIGGDGTMLGAMRSSIQYPDSVVYGINTGSLGFLTEEFNDNINTVLMNIGRKFGQIDERMALSGSIYIDGEMVLDGLVAMNEFVLTPLSVQSPLKAQVYINRKMVSENIGSGVLVATSTGSTAMSMSGGGAIVSPSTNIMQIVPVLPHTLTSRPVITSGRDTISLKADITTSRNSVEVYGDGICFGSYEKFAGEEIELKINKHPTTVRVYRPQNWDFFNVLREKMKW
jgi:NAD+ kinase